MFVFVINSTGAQGQMGTCVIQIQIKNTSNYWFWFYTKHSIYINDNTEYHTYIYHTVSVPSEADGKVSKWVRK